MDNNAAGVAIVGLGTVGSGVAEILLDQPQRLVRHAGRALQLRRVLVRDRSKPLRYALPDSLVTDDLETILRDDQIQVVAQLIGGLEPARTMMLQLLDSGKHIVTANKALLAQHGPELFDRARQLGRTIAFEASVAGGVPIVANLSQCLSANEIISLRGILNGTSNFIVSQMEEHGQNYDAAVRQAQELGFAEADPTMDVDGTDAAQKLAILANLAYGVHVDWTKVPRVGIDTLLPIDLQWARELGHRIKLLAVARLAGHKRLELHVSPTLVRIGTPMAEVRGANNAVGIVGDMVGSVFYQGLGAGRLPTASAVVADLVDTVVGRSAVTFKTLDWWSANRPKADLADPAETKSRFYVRLQVDDHPGVLAEITGIFSQHDISIASLIQRELVSDLDDGADSREDTSLIIMTHSTAAGCIDRALQEIDQLGSVKSSSVHMRVLD